MLECINIWHKHFYAWWTSGSAWIVKFVGMQEWYLLIICTNRISIWKPLLECVSHLRFTLSHFIILKFITINSRCSLVSRTILFRTDNNANLTHIHNFKFFANGHSNFKNEWFQQFSGGLRHPVDISVCDIWCFLRCTNYDDSSIGVRKRGEGCSECHFPI